MKVFRRGIPADAKYSIAPYADNGKVCYGIYKRQMAPSAGERFVEVDNGMGFHLEIDAYYHLLAIIASEKEVKETLKRYYDEEGQPLPYLP